MITIISSTTYLVRRDIPVQNTQSVGIFWYKISTHHAGHPQNGDDDDGHDGGSGEDSGGHEMVKTKGGGKERERETRVESEGG
jgi:hypothetical protein